MPDAVGFDCSDPLYGHWVVTYDDDCPVPAERMEYDGPVLWTDIEAVDCSAAHCTTENCFGTAASEGACTSEVVVEWPCVSAGRNNVSRLTVHVLGPTLAVGHVYSSYDGNVLADCGFTSRRTR